MQKGVYLIVYLCTIWVPVALEVKSGHQTPLKLELYTVATCHMDTGIWTQVLWKSSSHQCS